MLLGPFTRRQISAVILCAFLATSCGVPDVRANDLVLPAPGTRVHLSLTTNPPVLKGLKVDPSNPLRFEFVLDKGDYSVMPANDGIQRLIKYFLASLTIPEKDLWVNLSPYEKDRIVPDSFGQTEMGRDLLAQDYILKQITASLIYPEGEVGKKFWQRIYAEAAEKFGTTQIPVNTFNKVWIVPEKAVVYENAKAGTAYVMESKLKVMLEEDYLAVAHTGGQPGDTFRGKCPQAGCQANQPLDAKATQANPLTTTQQVLRDIVLPQLEHEVNHGANFSQLRQVYNSLILATWYKKKIKDSILAQVYADKNKVAGLVSLRGAEGPEAIYQKYLEAFKKGAYNYIKEEIDPATQQSIPRKYFSGGLTMNMAILTETSQPPQNIDQAQIGLVKIFVDLVSLVGRNSDFLPVKVFGATFNVRRHIFEKIEILTRENIRPSDIKDIVQLGDRLEQRNYVGENQAINFLQVEDILRKPDEGFIAVYRNSDERIVGYFIGQKPGPGSAIGSIKEGSVHKRYSGRGIGTALIAFTAEHLVTALHANRIWMLELAPETQAIVRRAQGFKPTGIKNLVVLLDPEVYPNDWMAKNGRNVTVMEFNKIAAGDSAMTALQLFRLAREEIKTLKTREKYSGLLKLTGDVFLTEKENIQTGDRLSAAELNIYAPEFRRIWIKEKLYETYGSVDVWPSLMLHMPKAAENNHLKFASHWAQDFLASAAPAAQAMGYLTMLATHVDHLRVTGLHTEEQYDYEQGRAKKTGKSVTIDNDLLFDKGGHNLFENYLLSVLKLKRDPQAWNSVLNKDDDASTIPITLKDAMLWGLIMAVDPNINVRTYVSDEPEILSIFRKKWGFRIGDPQAKSKVLRKILQSRRLKGRLPEIEELLVEAFEISEQEWLAKGMAVPYRNSQTTEALYLAYFTYPNFWNTELWKDYPLKEKGWIFLLGDKKRLPQYVLNNNNFNVSYITDYVQAFGQLNDLLPGVAEGIKEGRLLKDPEDTVSDEAMASETFTMAKQEIELLKGKSRYEQLVRIAENIFLTKRDDLKTGKRLSSQDVNAYAKKLRQMWKQERFSDEYGSIDLWVSLMLKSYEASWFSAQVRFVNHWVQDFLASANMFQRAFGYLSMLTIHTDHLRALGLHSEDEYEYVKGKLTPTGRSVTIDNDLVFGEGDYNLFENYIFTVLKLRRDYKAWNEGLFKQGNAFNNRIKIKDALLWGMIRAVDPNIHVHYDTTNAAVEKSLTEILPRTWGVQLGEPQARQQIMRQIFQSPRLKDLLPEIEGLLIEAFSISEEEWELKGMVSPYKDTQASAALTHFFAPKVFPSREVWRDYPLIENGLIFLLNHTHLPSELAWPNLASNSRANYRRDYIDTFVQLDDIFPKLAQRVQALANIQPGDISIAQLLNDFPLHNNPAVDSKERTRLIELLSGQHGITHASAIQNMPPTQRGLLGHVGPDNKAALESAVRAKGLPLREDIPADYSVYDKNGALLSTDQIDIYQFLTYKKEVLGSGGKDTDYEILQDIMFNNKLNTVADVLKLGRQRFLDKMPGSGNTSNLKQALEALGEIFQEYGWNLTLEGDRAMSATGGIDFKADTMDLETRNDNDGIKFTVDPAMLQELQNAPGLTPVIVGVEPLVDLRIFLGIN